MSKRRAVATTSSSGKSSAAEEAAFGVEVTDLKKDSESVRGRDATVIVEACDELKKRIEESASLAPKGKKRLLARLKEVRDAADSEDKMEKACGQWIQRAVMFVMIGPWLITMLGSLAEFALRPTMDVVQPVDLLGQVALVTGGCGALGSDLALMLAESGAGVVVGCHEGSIDDPVEVETARRDKQAAAKQRFRDMGFLRRSSSSSAGGADDAGKGNKGWIEVWPLRLESLASVRAFAGRYSKRFDSLHLLVHNAATKAGCVTTEDGYESALQVNYLSPFVLTQLLRPAMDAASPSSRVIHMTCDAGLQQPDWLPWPLRRVHPALLPRIDVDAIFEKQQQPPPLPAAAAAAAAAAGGGDAAAAAAIPLRAGCVPLRQYANSKLAIVAHSHELGRRLRQQRSSGRVVSHALNPGAMDTPFGRSASVAAPRQSIRASVMQYFPPVWIARKVWGLLFAGLGSLGLSLDVQGLTLRPATVGAKAAYHVATARALGGGGGGGGGGASRADSYAVDDEDDDEDDAIISSRHRTSGAGGVGAEEDMYGDAAAAGSLYSDEIGESFVDCGRSDAAACGKLEARHQPKSLADLELAEVLWSRTQRSLRSFLRPLKTQGTGSASGGSASGGKVLSAAEDDAAAPTDARVGDGAESRQGNAEKEKDGDDVEEEEQEQEQGEQQPPTTGPTTPATRRSSSSSTGRRQRADAISEDDVDFDEEFDA